MSIESASATVDSTQDSVTVDEIGQPGQSLIGSAGPQMVEVVLRGSLFS